MKKPHFIFLIAGTLSIGLSACSPGEQIVQGDCQTVFGGDMCTWAKMAGDRVVEVGATIPVSSIENAPAEQEMVWPPQSEARIPFPAEVTAKTGVTHLGVNWEAHGHPPGPYLTPHFDFHFNIESEAQIKSIDCSDISEPAVLPAGYELPDVDIPGMGTLIGLCVPEMGMHAARTDELNATGLFGATMIVGYYAGNAIFFEPMIARDKLLDKASFSLDVPSVQGPAYWPSAFNATYDAATDSYQFVFKM